MKFDAVLNAVDKKQKDITRKENDAKGQNAKKKKPKDPDDLIPKVKGV